MRLNRFLSQCGLGSRRGCEQIVLEGRVLINGKTVSELGTVVEPGDEVKVDGKVISAEAPLVIALHKPKGYICSRSDERDRMTIYALLPRQLQHLHHVGRLDKESEGLLLMTNRGDLSHHLIHPSKGAEKEYEVVVDKALDQTVMSRLVKGMMTEEGHAKAERAWMEGGYRCHLVLKQGLKRQIRLMLYQLGYEVERLTRIRIGWLELKGLPKGGYKQLSEAEVQRFFTEAGTTGRAKPEGRAKPKAAGAKSAGEGWEDGDDEVPAPSARPRRPGKPTPRGGGKSLGKPTGRARYAPRASERSFDESSETSRSPSRRGPRSGPPRRGYGGDRPAASERPDRDDEAPRRRSRGDDDFSERRGPPRRSGPPRRGYGGDRTDSADRSEEAPRRPRSGFGGRSGSQGDDDFSERRGPPRRSGPPRRGYGGDRTDSADRSEAAPRRPRSGFGDRSGPPRRPRPEEGFSDRSGPSGPPRRSGPPGRSGPPSRGGGPRKPGGSQGPRRKF